jgi:alkylation response protein AidB-like acyl-CoA dehydrogenase
MDFELPDEDDPRRKEVRAWLEAHPRPSGRELAEGGYVVPHWPKPWGLDADPIHQIIIDDELRRARVQRPMNIIGIGWAGPTIVHGGTQAQKDRYLMPLLSGEEIWCQLFSEPGAGSDLANLGTRAVRDGDTYVVNGQKIWTSMAHWADMIFALVRTNPAAKKQEGISFLLIDMKSPGITVRPIIGITLGHHLNEVFFENVRVPVENLIGEENKGWTYAKFLLANERVGNVDIAKLESYLGQIRRLLEETKEGGRALAEDPLFQRRLAELEVGFATVKALMADQLAAARTNGAPSLMGAAALKLRGTELVQAILQTGLEAIGRHGMVFQSDALHAGWNGELIGPGESADVIYEHLYRRAATIYGGSSEVQKNIIAKGALGL